MLTAAAIVIFALALAGIGLYLSFEHVAGFAHERLGFKTETKGKIFAVGVDVGIMVMIAVDLLMAWLKRPISWIRYPVWLLTSATVVLNAASAAPHGRPWGLIDYVALFAHAVVPILFITIVEIGRTSIDRVVRPEEHKELKGIPWQRWFLDFKPTFGMWRGMKLYEISYPELVRREQDLHSYKVWLTNELGGDMEQASEEQLLPMRMAKYGLTVDQALALPERQAEAAVVRDEEARLRKLEADTRRQENQDLHDARRDASKTRLQNHRIALTGETRAAETEAARKATAAETEEQAIESAATAEARQRSAEANHAAAEKERAAAETARVAAETRAEAAAALKREEELNKAAAEAEKAAAETAQAAAETRLAVAEIEERATEAEYQAKLGHAERSTRRVARMILQAGGNQDDVPLAEIMTVIGVASTDTASRYRKEAARLIDEEGYRP